MNFAGALLFLAIVLAFFSRIMREERRAEPDHVALECQRRALEEDIAARRTTLAVFTTLAQDIENQRHVLEIYQREIHELDQEYQEKVVRNALLDEIYGCFSRAWKESEHEY